MTTQTGSAPSIAAMDPAYRAFLTERLPELRRHRIPFWKKWRRGKHETLYHCLTREPIDRDGLFVEFGVFRGVSTRMIGRCHPNRRVFGFDSFEGFPDDGRRDWKGDFSTGGALPEVPPNVTLIKGYFDATLPAFVAAHAHERLALIHVDCDIYSSTRTVFELCRPLIRPGCLIVFDELLHYDGFLHNEMLAFWEFLRETGAAFEWVATAGDTMPLAEYLDTSSPRRAALKKMADWRRAGYDTSAAVRITAMP